MFPIYVLDNITLILAIVLFMLIFFMEWYNYQTYIFKRVQLNGLIAISLQYHYTLLYSPIGFSKIRAMIWEKQLQELYIFAHKMQLLFT